MADVKTLLELRERYLVEQRWPELADVLEQLCPVTEERDERLALYEELGAICVEQLGNAPRAFDAYRVVVDLRRDWTEHDALMVFTQILAIDPSHWPTMQRVDELLRRRGDAEAYEALAGHYIDLAAASVDDPEKFLRHQREAARIFEADLGSPESALVVLVTSVTAQTWQTGILEDIERLITLTGNWDEPIDRLRDVVGNMTDAPRAGRLHKRVGFWCMHARRPDDAAYHLRAALRHFPGDREAREALELLYRAEGRWTDIIAGARAERQAAANEGHAKELRDRLMALLEEGARTVSAPAERAAYLAELGQLHDAELGDRVAAVKYWEQALNAEPETIEAARPLVDYYLERNRWERAAPVLETIVKMSQQRRGLLDPREENIRWLQYADVLDRVGNEKLALKAYRQAYELDRNNPHTLERLGLLLFEADEFDQAYHVFIQLVDRYEREVDRPILVEVLRKAAAIKAHHKDTKTAMGLVDRALRVAPDDRDTLKLAADIAAMSGDLSLSMKARSRLVESEVNPTVKFADLVNMGDTWAQKGAWEQAGRSYVNALKVEPNSVAVLRKLLEAFQKMARWSEAIGVLERLAGQEDDRIKRAKLFYTMGIIARDEVRAPERAVGYFDRALDEDTELLKAFEAIDRVLTERRAWKELERAYRRMLHRVAENERGLETATREKLDLMLWRNLGEVYRSRLGDLKAAIQAFETVLAMRPDDEGVRLILAELYERAGVKLDGAVEQHRRVLEKDPTRADSLHGVFRAFMASKRYDAAHCVAGVLHWMNRGDTESNDFYRTYLGRNLKVAKGSFYPELLDKVYPRAQNRVVNGVMAHLAVVLRPLFAHDLRDFGVNPKTDGVDPKSSRYVFTQMYQYVTQTMALVPAPHLYARRDHPLGLRALNAEPPALLLGSDILGDDAKDDREMAFRLAKMVAWVRPEHYLAAIGNSPGQLQVMFVSAMDYALGRKPTAGRDGAALVKAIKGAPSQSQLQIQSLIKTYVRYASEPPDMSQWATQAEHATSRFGLIFCGEFQKAAEQIKREPPALTAATVDERLTELVRFAISEEYFEIRKELGLSLS